MNIKIFGSNCSNGIKLKKIINRVIHSLNYNINIEEVNEDIELKKINIKNKPGLVINGLLVSEGKVLTDREVVKYLRLDSV